MTKSADAFRTISEVAEVLDTPAHVLRFWESRFPQIKPVKRAGGRRYYRPADISLLAGIKQLLHDDGLTIRGVQKILRENGVRHVAGIAQAAAEDSSPVETAPSDKTAKAGSDAHDRGAEAPWPASPTPDPTPDAETFPADPEDAPTSPVEATDSDDAWPTGTLFDAPQAAPSADAPEAPMAVDVPSEPEESQVIAMTPSEPQPEPASASAPAPAADTLQPEQVAARLRALSTRAIDAESAAALGNLRSRVRALRDRLAAPPRPPAP